MSHLRLLDRNVCMYVQVWVNPSKQLRNPVHCMRKVFSSFFLFYCAASVLQKCIYIILYLFYEQLFGISVYACNLHKINTPFGPEKCAVFFRNFFDLFILFFFFLFNHSATQKVFHFFYAAGNPIFNSCLWVFSHWV